MYSEINKQVFLFSTMRELLCAGRLAERAGINHRILPKPTSVDNNCGMCIAVAGDACAFAELLHTAGIAAIQYSEP